MQRMAVIARLRPGAAAEAARLIALGPPFDPRKSELERHFVFLAADLAVFVFEGASANAVLKALGGPDEQSMLAAWEPLLDGTPTIAREAYAWTSPAYALDGSWGE